MIIHVYFQVWLPRNILCQMTLNLESGKYKYNKQTVELVIINLLYSVFIQYGQNVNVSLTNCK